MISLKNTLSAIGSSISSLSSSISSLSSRISTKAEKTWTLVYSGTGGNYTNLSTSGYTEAMVIVSTNFGVHTAILPVSYLTTSQKEVYLGGGVGVSLASSRHCGIYWGLTYVGIAIYTHDGATSTTGLNIRIYAR